MANDDSKKLFTIDLNKLGAKLHLAGKEQVPNSIVINTGIEDAQGNETLKAPGEVTLKVEPGKNFCIGMARQISYQVGFDVKKLPEFAGLVKDFNAEKDNQQKSDQTAMQGSNDKSKEKSDNAEEQKSSTDSSKTPEDNKPNTPKPITAKADRSKVNEAAEPSDSNVDNNGDNTDKNTNRFTPSEEFQKKCYAFFKKCELKGYKEAKDFTESLKSFQTAIKLENQHRKNENKKALDKLKADCMKDLKDYITAFQGKDAVKYLMPALLQEFYLDSDNSAKSQNDFEDCIEDRMIVDTKIRDAVKEKIKKLQETKPNDYITHHVGFYVVMEMSKGE